MASKTIRDAKRKALTEERAQQDAQRARMPTADSFQNFTANLGIGTSNVMSHSTYGYNPITRNRVLLEWIHRSSWIAGVAVDLVAQDMTRAGVDLHTQMPPEQLQQLDNSLTELNVWGHITESLQWARLYGGALAVMLIDGQKMSEPLDLARIGRDQFRGVLVLDRWMIEPSFERLVSTMGPNLGLPMYYHVTADSPALPRMTIHHSRAIRLEGIKLPYWQRVTENLWGLSVLERLYDRLIAFDSTSTGAAQLVYKAWLRVAKIQNLRELVADGAPGAATMQKYMQMMAMYQSLEGITVIDSEDDLQVLQHSFAGLADIMNQFGQQISGALQIPLVRLFGQSPAGLSASGDSDLRTYYDGIRQQQERMLRVGVTKIYVLAARSLGLHLEDDARIEFRPLWQETESGKATTAKTITDTIIQAYDGTLISQQTALRELRSASRHTGVWASITDQDIEAADPTIPEPTPPETESVPGMPPPLEENPETGTPVTADAAAVRDDLKHWHGLEIIIENPKGSVRRGVDPTMGAAWQATLAADYGYIRHVRGSDGDYVDCFVGPERISTSPIFIIDQRDIRTLQFDEHKVMLGFSTKEAALAAYCASYTDNAAGRVGAIMTTNLATFKEWLGSHDMSVPASGRFNQ